MKFTFVSAAAVVFAAQQVIASGPVAGCLQTHKVVAGESCDGIAATFKITPDQFYAMNPGLHHAGDHLCDNLDDGKAYCVCTKKPCVAEPAGGNSTSSASGSAPASSGSSAASSASGSAAASGSASISPIAASSSSGAAAASSSGASAASSSPSSSSSSGSAAAASESKTNTAVSSAPTKTALALSIVAIAAVVLL
ncbi:hypothetical protein BCR42DRAFT_403117 [Absidia repens]|uniref:LysM domain-containing protein n=1 Tax=Absidia repens TaxID=90262 RepID=A0A1X2IYU2_9FUNG|nr:hypothetical protein BCR42DRAFT_403117 [Absidia repens]